MRILYYSVHHVLEDDEVRLFKSMGHHVICLGVNNKTGASQNLREAIDFDEDERDMYDIYENLGGDYFSAKANIIPDRFYSHIDLFIIVHDISVVEKYWDRFNGKPVIWRAIGQGIESFEARLAALRDLGLMVVRYSPLEEFVPNSAGQDAIIRFYKDESIYTGWTGSANRVLTFTNDFAARYPREAKAYTSVCQDLPAVLGGFGNVGFPNAVGVVTPSEQLALYRESAAYFYCSGLLLPYTLNFMEAWMVGIPVVVYAPDDGKGKYFELPSLIRHGESGYICSTPRLARDTLLELIADKARAARVGENGRSNAIRLFGKNAAATAWNSLFERCFGS